MKNRRSYHQHCAVARGLDVLGDRWTLLIVRNLILGPQSWSELRQALPGVAKNLLSERLKQLVQDGIIEHQLDRYELSGTGTELEPILFALADWSERHGMGDPQHGDVFRVRYLMTSIRRHLLPTRRQASLQLWVDGAPFWVRLGKTPTVRQGTDRADDELRVTSEEFRQILTGEARASGVAATFRSALRTHPLCAGPPAT